MVDAAVNCDASASSRAFAIFEAAGFLDRGGWALRRFVGDLQRNDQRAAIAPRDLFAPRRGMTARPFAC